MKTPSLAIRMASVATIIGLLSIMNLYAQQGTSGFSYQAVARDQMGAPLSGQALTVRIGIMADSENGELIWQEEHDVTTSPLGLFTLMVGDPGAINQSGSAGSFDLIDWSAHTYYLKVSVRTDDTFMEMGSSPIQTVPIAQYANTASSANTSFSIQPSEDAMPGEALFEVKRKDGQPVFAVYEDMVWVYAEPDTNKGLKGGFAVGGYSRNKGVTEEYMRVTADSVRVYVNDDPAKGVKGGFAVGGYSRTSKGLSQDFLTVSPDSVRVFIDSEAGAKGVKGGFAVGGYSRTSKGSDDLFFNLSPKDNAELITDKSQILFYPLKDAFMAGTINVGDPDSVGLNSTSLGYKSVAMGRYSQGFGFQSKALGDYSTAIGREAIAMDNSFALGNTTRATGDGSYAFGTGATASGDQSFAFGSVGIDTAGQTTGVPTAATGSYSIAFGMGARAQSSGAMSLGPSSSANGFQSIAIGSGTTATGNYSTAIGYRTSTGDHYATAMGYRTSADGYKSIAIGTHYTYTIYIFGKLGKPLTINRPNIAYGDYSISLGNGNSSYDGGLAIGSSNDAHDQGAVALGFSNTARRKFSLAAGYNNNAEGYYSMAIGENVTSKAMNSLAIGTFNVVTGDTAQWIATDPLFQIGNGTSTDPHDAFRVYKNGRTNIYPVNTSYGLYVYTTANSDNTSSTLYGVRSYLISTDSNLTGGYSGRFTGSLSSGTYHGLYADIRTGAAKDVAEYILDSRGDTEAGDVLVADPGKDESVIVSSIPYQASVLGVVSTDPHMVMGMELVVDEETGEPLEGVSATRLALSGRVPVKVTEENGPIIPGDLLTTSSTPGCAMKWSLLDVNQAQDFEELKSMLAENEMRRNAIIGKAVSSSAAGSGTVMVLISLQ